MKQLDSERTPMPKPICRTRIAVAALVVPALALAGAGPAWAGTYVMRSCNVPGYPSAPMGPWQAAPSPGTAAVDTCSTGGSVGMGFPGVPFMAQHTRAAINLVRPTQGPWSRIGFAGIRLWAVARLDGSGGQLSVQTFRSDSASAGHGYALAIPPGAEALPREWDLYAPTTTAVQLALVCNDPPDRPVLATRLAGEDCYPADALPFEMRGIEVRLEENAAPAAAIDGGTALASGPQAGERTLQFSATDLESGVEKVEAVIGDTVVASRDLVGRCPHTGFAACPKSDSGVLTLDTRAVPNGTHRLTLRVTDAAGNAQIVPSTTLLEIANASPAIASAPSSPGAPASQGQARLTARFSTSSRSSIVVPYRRAVRVSGRLSFAAARPPAGSKVAIVARTATAGARDRTIGSVLTRADGTFSYRLAARGPSRSIRFLHVAAGISATSKALHLRVRAASRLTVSLRGTTLSYDGQVVSGPIPRKGKTIQLWGRAPGFAWSKFLTLVTDREGRFAGTYRLRARRPGVRLHIQVRIPQAKGYPYVNYRSSTRTLRVS
jgi:hypothetical protein